MNKQLYSTDTHWYDEQIHDKIVALDDKHHNAIPIFGGALWASKYITDTFDLSQFVSYLPTVAQNAKFYKWHDGIVGALRTFCNICTIDPALIEVYLGASFNELFA